MSVLSYSKLSSVNVHDVASLRVGGYHSCVRLVINRKGNGRINEILIPCMNLNYSQKTSCFNSPIPHRHTSSPIRLYAYNFAKVIFTGEKGIQKGLPCRQSFFSFGVG